MNDKSTVLQRSISTPGAYQRQENVIENPEAYLVKHRPELPLPNYVVGNLRDHDGDSTLYKKLLSVKSLDGTASQYRPGYKLTDMCGGMGVVCEVIDPPKIEGFRLSSLVSGSKEV